MLARTDRRWLGSDVEPCDDGGLPAIDPGPDGSCRISSEDGEDGLHLHRRGDLIEVHLDRVDGRRFPAVHLLEATAFVGLTLLGLGIGAAAGGGKGAVVGGIIGGATGAFFARRPKIYFGLSPDGRVVPAAESDRAQVAQRIASYAR